MRAEPDHIKMCISIGDVCQQTSLGKSCIYSMVKIGKFPKPRQLTAGRVGWMQNEISDWIEKRPVAATDIAA